MDGDHSRLQRGQEASDDYRLFTMNRAKGTRNARLSCHLLLWMVSSQSSPINAYHYHHNFNWLSPFGHYSYPFQTCPGPYPLSRQKAEISCPIRVIRSHQWCYELGQEVTTAVQDHLGAALPVTQTSNWSLGMTSIIINTILNAGFLQIQQDNGRPWYVCVPESHW